MFVYFQYIKQNQNTLPTSIRKTSLTINCFGIKQTHFSQIMGNGATRVKYILTEDDEIIYDRKMSSIFADSFQILFQTLMFHYMKIHQ